MQSNTKPYFVLVEKTPHIVELNPWSERPCTKKYGCTAQPHQPSGTISFCDCTRCGLDKTKCSTCNRTRLYTLP